MVRRSAEEDGRKDREARILQQEIKGCAFHGKPIEVTSLPGLRAWKGKLFSADQTERGTEVHAGSFLRERRIVLDSALRDKERQRILLHELFHFAWIRLSNAQRQTWAAILDCELAAKARGELGWSAEWRKLALPQSPRLKRDYVSESFCDTAAWLYGSLQSHDEFTLAKRWREKRRNWFNQTFPDDCVKV